MAHVKRAAIEVDFGVACHICVVVDLEPLMAGRRTNVDISVVLDRKRSGGVPADIAVLRRVDDAVSANCHLRMRCAGVVANQKADIVDIAFQVQRSARHVHVGGAALLPDAGLLGL